MSKNKLLNVIQTSKNEVERKWGTQLPILYPNTLYIRCNSKGIVNWNIAPIFRTEELKIRGKYKVIKKAI